MDWLNRSKEFLSEVRSEVRKVTFPSRDEVMGTTVVVVITSFVFAIYLWGVDLLIQRGYMLIVKAFQ